jgi:hypothetical protein
MDTIAPEPLYLKTDCHPEAKGRKPKAGEHGWTLNMMLEDGRMLYLQIGKVGRDNFRMMLAQEELEDICEHHRIGFPLTGDMEKDLATAKEFVKHDRLIAEEMCPNGHGPLVASGQNNFDCPICLFHFQIVEVSA